MSSVFTASAQVDSVIGQVTSSINESVAGGITGDGRFVVFESSGDVATYRVDNQPNNADGNRELFIFDYAQRRIFQITNTKALLKDATKAPTFDNVRVNIANIRPVISSQPDAEGNYWIAFSSNATCSYPGNPNGGITSVTNPGNFDANAPSEPGATPDDPPVNKCSVTSGSSTINNLVNDGNTELWLYKVPAVPPVADLSVGEEVPLTVLSGGTFTRLTNTRPSRLPVAGTTTSQPIIADDNHDSSIDSTGAAVSFTSNRDLLPCPTAPSATCGNAATLYDNDEIFSYVRSNNALKQITATPRGTVGNPIYNTNSTITDLSGGGWRIAFMSNADKPVTGMTGSNADNNEEIFYVDLTAQGGLGDALKQVTTTARTNPGDVVNILNYGRRMSRDGRYIAFDSTADLAPPTGQQPGANKPGFGTFVYDTQTSTFRIFLARSDADSGAFGGDVQRYPSFTTAFDSRGIAQPTLVLETRMNIKSDGTVATVADEGLNNISDRPAQIYSFLLNVSAAADPAKFIRITKLPRPLFFLASVQPLTTNFLERMAFNLSQTEFGTGNSDLNSEVFYSVLPEVVSQSPASLNFATGASRIPVTASPVPTPSPTATPTATPTPSPSATPTPSPTPQQPSAVQGVAPGMLAILDYDSGLTHPIAAQTAVGSLDRRFTLPIELSGVTLTVNGAAAGLKMVSRRQIVFVVPPGLGAADAGTVYPVVVQNNGVVFRGSVTVVPARPDIFTNLLTPGPGGRAKVFNATNRVLTTEPFAVRTFRLRGSRLVPSVLRVYLTGVDSGRFITSPSQITVRIGNTQITPVTTLPVLFEPGVFTFDFTLPASIAGAGDQPIVVSVTIGGITYTSRLDDTAPRLFIL